MTTLVKKEPLEFLFDNPFDKLKILVVRHVKELINNRSLKKRLTFL
jgi:hypothetical protein